MTLITLDMDQFRSGEDNWLVYIVFNCLAIYCMVKKEKHKHVLCQTKKKGARESAVGT